MFASQVKDWPCAKLESDMDEAGSGDQIHELTDLDVEAIGLVRRGANKRQFYVLKSESGGNEMEQEHSEEQEFSDVLAQLETVEGLSEGLLEQVKAGFEAIAAKIPNEPEPEHYAEMSAADKKVLAAAMRLGKGKLGDRLYAMLEKLVGNPGDGKEYGYPPEEKSSEEVDEFAERMEAMRTELTEKFAEEIKAAQTQAEQAQKRADEERHLRRLAEFTEQARGYSFAAGEPEKFAEDMLALHDHDAELYARMEARIKALDEQVRQGALFEQFSVAGGESDSRHPFETKVEQLRVEHYSTEDYYDGYSKAMEMAERMHPDLAARYERETREV
jgi:hypothetical protein